MKKDFFVVCIILLGCLAFNAYSQEMSERVKSIFPEGTIVHGNIPYANDTLKKHLLDIYLPANATGRLPLVVWVHGGGWLSNDKYADMGYMRNTVKGFIDRGYALASIDYRFSTQAPMPAQMLDCYQALEYLYQHAKEYNLDRDKIVLAGFSAGGHLASLLGLSINNKVAEFYPNGKPTHFKIIGVLDFYGPSDLLLLSGKDDPKSPEGLLVGAAPAARPDLSKSASPVTYADKNDPPFLIVHGEMDNTVPNEQSKVLNRRLTEVDVNNELIIVPGAPHFGSMFDQEWIQERVFSFLTNVF